MGAKEQRVPLEGSKRIVMPPIMNLSVTAMSSAGAYLLEDGISMFLWLGRALPPAFVQALLGIPSLEGVDTSTIARIPVLKDVINVKVRNIVEAIREGRHIFQKLHIIKQGDSLERVMM